LCARVSKNGEIEPDDFDKAVQEAVKDVARAWAEEDLYRLFGQQPSMN
jgi:hypothetical protein